MSHSRIIKVEATDLLSVDDAATLLKKPRPTLYRWIQKGKLIVIKLGGIIYVPKSEVERLKAEDKEFFLIHKDKKYTLELTESQLQRLDGLKSVAAAHPEVKKLSLSPLKENIKA